MEDYVKSHDFTFPLPGLESTVTLEGRSLAHDELNIKLKYDDGEGRQVEGKFLSDKIFYYLEIYLSVIQSRIHTAYSSNATGI